jgi:hypothetical protein
MAMNDRDLFAQADQQVSALKERIARQREAVTSKAERPRHGVGRDGATGASGHPSRVREAPPASL